MVTLSTYLILNDEGIKKGRNNPDFIIILRFLSVFISVSLLSLFYYKLL